MGFWNREEERQEVQRKQAEEARQNAAKIRESRSNHDSRMHGMRQRVSEAESSIQDAQEEGNRILDDGFRRRQEERNRQTEREEETRRSNREKAMKTVREGNAKIEELWKYGLEVLRTVEEDHLYDDEQLEEQRNRLAEEHSRELKLAQKTKNETEEMILQEMTDQRKKLFEEEKRFLERHENMQKNNEMVLSEYQEAVKKEEKSKFETKCQMGLNAVIRMDAMEENKKMQHSEQLEKSIGTQWMNFKTTYLNEFSQKRQLRTSFEKNEWDKMKILPSRILKDLSRALRDGNRVYQSLRDELFRELCSILNDVSFVLLADEPRSEESRSTLKELIISFGELWMNRPRIETSDVFMLMNNTDSNSITNK